MPARLRVTLVKSPVSHTARTRGTVRALGLHRIGETVEINDTPEMRGMTRAVAFLLRTEPVGEGEPAAEAATAGGSASAASKQGGRAAAGKEEAK